VTFLIAEDEALRDLLKGMTVADNKESARPVGVWFGQPDPEVRQQQFPFITIDLIDVRPSVDRMMSAQQVDPWYFQPEVLDSNGVYDSWTMYMPIPIDLDYQVTTFARQPRHDRQMMAQIFRNRLPFKFGALVCKEKAYTDSDDPGDDPESNDPEAPESPEPSAQVESSDSSALEEWAGTVRRLDVLGIRKRDTTESGKRMFMNAITVRVSSEMPTRFAERLYKKVQVINGTVVPGGESFTITAEDETPTEPVPS
jgi:hypothetical protein